MAQAITAALFHRERTGVAQRIDVAMLDAAVAFNWPDAMYNHSFLDDPPAPFPEYGSMSRLWDAADGQVAIGMMQDVEFVAMAKALGRQDLADDPRFRSMGGRMRNRADWAPEFARELVARRKDALMEGFIREGAVGGKVNSLAEVPGDPQVVHNEILVETANGAIGRVRGARPPARFAASPAVAAGAAPALGEHGRAVLAGLGFDAAEIAAFAADGVLIG
jgi:crotonobetainyl-CoA:carnitine CoA-transferase CaiB-like acyl-CoA transferase